MAAYQSQDDIDEKLVKTIDRRWREFNVNDIQMRDLPEWQIIVKDIKDLLALYHDYHKQIQASYTDGYNNGREAAIFDYSANSDKL